MVQRSTVEQRKQQDMNTKMGKRISASLLGFAVTFGNCSKIMAESSTSRTVCFPTKPSDSPGTVIALPITDNGNILKKKGRLIGPAVGAISVGKSEVLYLIVTPEGASKLGCLSTLKPNDLHQIRMHDVHLAKNSLTEISKLKGLQDLDLSNTDIDDKGLKTIAQSAALKKLDISKTLVRGAGICDLRALKELTDLDIGNNGINDFFVASIVQSLPQLEALNLSETKITDASVRHVAKLKYLRKLNLQGDKITDAGLNALKRSTKLKSLNLKETQITVRGKRDLHKSLPNCEIRDSLRN